MIKQGKYENTVEVILTKKGTPLLFKEKVDELMKQGAFPSRKKAEEWLETTPIVLCLVYQKDSGLYAVEDTAMDCTVSPYDAKTPSEKLNRDPDTERTITSSELCARLLSIGKDAETAILSLMSAHCVQSLNVGEYYREFDITNYSFYDVDKHGFGMVLSLDGIAVSDNKINLTFVNKNGDESFSKDWDELYSDEEKYYVFNMIEEIFGLIVDENEPVPVIPVGCTFEETFDV